jgi:phage terminase large subunit-like protein
VTIGNTLHLLSFPISVVLVPVNSAFKVLTSKWVRLQIERHIDDLENAHECGLRFNPARGLRVIKFIESFCVGTEGEHDGKPFILEPWSAALLYVLYAWEWTDGRRRFKYAYVEVGRENLKSTLASQPQLSSPFCPLPPAIADVVQHEFAHA